LAGRLYSGLGWDSRAGPRRRILAGRECAQEKPSCCGLENGCVSAGLCVCACLRVCVSLCKLELWTPLRPGRSQITPLVHAALCNVNGRPPAPMNGTINMIRAVERLRDCSPRYPRVFVAGVSAEHAAGGPGALGDPCGRRSAALIGCELLLAWNATRQRHASSRCGSRQSRPHPTCNS
jgi:hypothetical protein